MDGDNDLLELLCSDQPTNLWVNLSVLGTREKVTTSVLGTHEKATTKQRAVYLDGAWEHDALVFGYVILRTHDSLRSEERTVGLLASILSLETVSQYVLFGSSMVSMRWSRSLGFRAEDVWRHRYNLEFQREYTHRYCVSNGLYCLSPQIAVKEFQRDNRPV